jgi:hypothetical protein
MTNLDITSILQTILDSTSIVRDGPIPATGEPLKLEIIPSAVDLKVPVLADGKIDITWLAKQVRFSDQLAAPTSPTAVEDHVASSTEVVGGQSLADLIVLLAGPPLAGSRLPHESVNIGITTIPGTPPTAQAVSPPAIPSSEPVELPTAEGATGDEITDADLLSGVPGLLGQVSAKIPVPTLAPVGIKVEWRVELATYPGANTFPLNPTWVPINAEITADGMRDYLAPLGLLGPSVELVLPPSFIDWKTSVPLGTGEADAAQRLEELKNSMTHYRVIAKITVSALGLSVGPRELTVPVDVPAIGIPRVAVFFRNINFDPHFDQSDNTNTDGAALLLVPNSFPVQTYEQIAPTLSQLAGTLTQVQTTLRDTKAGLKLAGFLLGLNSLISAVDAQPMFQFRVADQIDQLSKIIFRNGGWKLFPPAIFSTVDADERISSMIFLGVDGSGIGVFNQPHQQHKVKGGHGAFKLITGVEMWAAIRNFQFHDDKDVILIPGGASIEILSRESQNFNDEADSLLFS